MDKWTLRPLASLSPPPSLWVTARWWLIDECGPWFGRQRGNKRIRGDARSKRDADRRQMETWNAFVDSRQRQTDVWGSGRRKHTHGSVKRITAAKAMLRFLLVNYLVTVQPSTCVIVHQISNTAPMCWRRGFNLTHITWCHRLVLSTQSCVSTTAVFIQKHVATALATLQYFVKIQD